MQFQALGEAEAELAAMSHAGRIDAIVTNDIDTFVFGGCNVMRTYAYASCPLLVVDATH
jgi:5'-3' exonuclease